MLRNKMKPAPGNKWWSFSIWTGLTEKLIKKYPLDSEITIKGHLDQQKQPPVAAAVTNVAPVATKEVEKKITLPDIWTNIRSSSRWDFHFHSYVLTIYVRLYWLLEIVVFYSLVRKGYIHKVSVQLVPKYFSRDCSTDSISCSERKNGRKQY